MITRNAIHARRLVTGDREIARKMFALLADVFAEEPGPLSDAYIDRLLERADFWAIAAIMGEEVIGGATAHTLPMTRVESSEVFIYDFAVRQDLQRAGIGRQLMAALREAAGAAGIRDLFVAADEEDAHALDFYRAVGGAAAPVTIFSFTR
ncbi:MAG TPA: GNAT family N-acetyltransferase [Steroidobacteraceae bacterium]|jgi:aminoglycoside 3-N-acetyltransferase I|nr:GNAT family N-acetyltransferase [Steroidobacteraceae bacterium]